MIFAGGLFDPNQLIARVKLQGNNAVTSNIGKFCQSGFFDSPLPGDHEEKTGSHLVLRDTEDGLNIFAGFNIDKINNGLAFGLAGTLRQFKNPDFKHPAAVREN